VAIDCLRYDYAQRMEKTQALMREDGWCTFTKHYAAAHCSDPNFATMLTGFTPDAHGIYTQQGVEYEEVLPTLPYLLRELGYKCWAYGPVKCAGFYRYGFDEFLWHKSVDVSEVGLPGCMEVTEALGEPWFGFIRTMDCHYPYCGEKMPNAGDGTVIVDGYTRAVQHTDDVLAEYLPKVLGRWPNTWIVFTADHGEALGEHGVFDHLFTLYEVLVRVPLYIRPPNGGGGSYFELTQHQDLFATLADAVGHKQLAQGRSLIPLFKGKVIKPPKLMWFAGWGAAVRDMWKHRAVRNERWKYTVNWHLKEGVGFELYNVDEDPLEELNLFDQRPDLAKWLAGEMRKKHPEFPYPTTAKVPSRVFVADFAQRQELGGGHWQADF